MPSKPPQPTPEVLDEAAALFKGASEAERVSRLRALLHSSVGPLIRRQLKTRVLELLRVETLVPDEYAQWRPMIEDALRFLFLHISDARLAPKLVEQLGLPPETPGAIRLLRLVARMPGFQKLGQVLARNRHLNPALRKALIELENGISDANALEMRTIIAEQLGPRLQSYAVEIAPEILSEATVSAVLRFTWRNPRSSQRERGVFKVLKPHVPAFFAEDMELLQQLAEHLESRHSEYGLAANVLLDTFGEVRQLLQHEVDFAQEQATLLKVPGIYGAAPGVRTPRLIAPLCGSQLTAMTEEPGVKVTDAVAGMPLWRRQQVAAQLAECLAGVPLLAREPSTIFHADPHAGNLLYDKETSQIVILDWALTEQLSYEQRRHIALLSILFVLRDATGMVREIQALCQGECGDEQMRIIRRSVAQTLEQLPAAAWPGLMEVIRLLDRLALEGLFFPASLLMFRKVLFTLDGILHEIAGDQFSIDLTLARYCLHRWLANWPALDLPLDAADWLAVQWSAAFYGSRLWTEALHQNAVWAHREPHAQLASRVEV